METSSEVSSDKTVPEKRFTRFQAVFSKDDAKNEDQEYKMSLRKKNVISHRESTTTNNMYYSGDTFQSVNSVLSKVSSSDTTQEYSGLLDLESLLHFKNCTETALKLNTLDILFNIIQKSSSNTLLLALYCIYHCCLCSF